MSTFAQPACMACNVHAARREERLEKSGPLGAGRSDALNPDLEEVEAALQAACQAGAADAFCLYLYGVVLLDK